MIFSIMMIYLTIGFSFIIKRKIYIIIYENNNDFLYDIFNFKNVSTRVRHNKYVYL